LSKLKELTRSGSGVPGASPSSGGGKSGSAVAIGLTHPVSPTLDLT
jgi:hypothetical protein